jgi:hypothetical protein
MAYEDQRRFDSGEPPYPAEEEARRQTPDLKPAIRTDLETGRRPLITNSSNRLMVPSGNVV